MHWAKNCLTAGKSQVLCKPRKKKIIYLISNVNKALRTHNEDVCQCFKMRWKKKQKSQNLKIDFLC